MLSNRESPHGFATPCGVVFHRETLRRVGGNGESGDNWSMTWAQDGSKFTSMDDGNWLGEPPKYNNHLFRIVGGPEDFSREDVPGYPRFIFDEGGWFGYGLLSIDGTLTPSSPSARGTTGPAPSEASSCSSPRTGAGPGVVSIAGAVSGSWIPGMRLDTP